MSKYYIYQDTKRCIGCFSCESHCKTKNNLPIGPRLTQIIPVGPKKVNNLPRMAYVFMPCFHCQDPWCVAACPTGAMQKRPKDGIVFVDDKLCVGCKACITACPWGTPQWNPATGKAVKCDYAWIGSTRDWRRPASPNASPNVCILVNRLQKAKQPVRGMRA